MAVNQRRLRCLGVGGVAALERRSALLGCDRWLFDSLLLFDARPSVSHFPPFDFARLCAAQNGSKLHVFFFLSRSALNPGDGFDVKIPGDQQQLHLSHVQGRSPFLLHSGALV